MAKSRDNYVTHANRSQVKFSKKQSRFREIFARASAYASDIINDPVKKAAYKVGSGKSVYLAAIAY